MHTAATDGALRSPGSHAIQKKINNKSPSHTLGSHDVAYLSHVWASVHFVCPREICHPCVRLERMPSHQTLNRKKLISQPEHACSSGF